jgi:hypothetical protein
LLSRSERAETKQLRSGKAHAALAAIAGDVQFTRKQIDSCSIVVNVRNSRRHERAQQRRAPQWGVHSA